MLPLIALGVVVAGTVALSGCSSHKPKPKVSGRRSDDEKPPIGPEPKLGFEKQDNPLAASFYEELSRHGVTLRDLDIGFRTTNYAKIHCPDASVTSCIKGAGDGKVTSDEVLEYVFDHSEQYRSMIESSLGSPLPWSLDDLDPTTPFDQVIRNKIRVAIERLKQTLKAKGLHEGTEQYKEMMAIGLFYFAATPDALTLSNSPRHMRHFEILTRELVQLGLSDYRDFLRSAGGIALAKGDYREERSAIEALKAGEGECTEESKVLYAVFQMAGLAPEFVFITSENVRSNRREVAQYLETLTSSNQDHVCIGLLLNGKRRLFDLSLFDASASHVNPVPLSLRQYMSFDYLNSGGVLSQKGDIRKALAAYTRSKELDAHSAPAYNNLGNVQSRAGFHDAAIPNLAMAIELDPHMTMAYLNRGVSYLKIKELNKAIADMNRVLELDRSNVSAYNMRGLILMHMGDLDAALADLNQAIALDPQSASAYLDRGSIEAKMGKIAEAREDFESALEKDPHMVNVYANMALLCVHEGDSVKTIEYLASYFERFSQPPQDMFRTVEETTTLRMRSDETALRAFQTFSEESGALSLASVEAHCLVAFSLWKAGKYEQSVEVFESLQEINFVKRPSASTRQFFQMMQSHMPKDMEDAQGVKETLADLRRKLR